MEKNWIMYTIKSRKKKKKCCQMCFVIILVNNLANVKMVMNIVNDVIGKCVCNVVILIYVSMAKK